MPRDTKGKAIEPGADMVHMKRESKEDKDGVGAAPYPYGLRMHLDHDGMKKVGMHDMPGVGDEIELRARARVTGASSEAIDGKTDEHRRVEMQITHLGVHHKADGMKSEDQGGSGKAEAGHVTEKKGATGGDTKKEKATGKDASYGRKRH